MATEQFYSILTNVGKAKLANSAALGNKVNFSKLKLGDGNGNYYNPSENQTELINKVWEGNIGNVKIDDENSNWVIIETVIPATDGGFYIREGGIFDEEGDLIAISKLAETYKPLASEGSSKDLIVRIILEVSNASSVTLKLDPTVILATKKDIDILQASITNINAQLNDMMYETAGGTGTAITLSMQPLKQGYNKTFIASANNNGAATTINGKNLYKPGTTTSPKLIEGKAYTVWYNSVGDCFFIKASAEGTVTSSHVLAGYTFSNDDDTGLLGTLDLSKLISENIRSGVTINGITGHPHVVNTGDAVLDPQFLLTGYSGYDDGVKKNGTMPNLSGNWQTAAFRGNSGNGVLAQIPRGYSDGGTNTYTYCVDSNFIASNIIAGKSIFGVAGTARPILNYAEGSYTFGASYNNLYLDLGVIPISYDFIYGVLNVDFINVMNSSVVKTDTKEVLIFPWNGAIYSMYPKYQTAATDSGSPAFALRNEYNNTVPLVNANYSTGNTNCKVQGTFTWKAYKLK